MTIIARPPVENGQGLPDPFDDLLRNFFRAEMPEPWPEMKRPESHVLPFVRPRVSRFASTRSRLALAASVTLLLLGSWFFSGARNNTPVEGVQPHELKASPGPGTTPIDPHKTPRKIEKVR